MDSVKVNQKNNTNRKLLQFRFNQPCDNHINYCKKKGLNLTKLKILLKKSLERSYDSISDESLPNDTSTIKNEILHVFTFLIK